MGNQENSCYGARERRIGMQISGEILDGFVGGGVVEGKIWREKKQNNVKFTIKEVLSNPLCCVLQ